MSFVRVAGVLLTFAYLIVPAVCGATLVQSWKSRMIVGWIVATAASLIGLVASYLLDLPTGAAVVCACGLLLIIAAIVARLRGSALSS